MPSETQAKKARRDATARTFVRRGDLTPGSDPGGVAPAAFLRALKEYDKGLEVWFQPVAKYWVLYRRIRSGGAASNDLLMKEMDLCGEGRTYRPLGSWVFNKLRKQDLCNRFQTGCPEMARKRYVNWFEDMEKKREEKHVKNRRELSKQLGKDLGWCVRGRGSFTRRVKKRKKPGVKVIWEGKKAKN